MEGGHAPRMPAVEEDVSRTPTASEWLPTGKGTRCLERRSSMDLNKRALTRILVLAALVMGLLAAVPAFAATVNLEGVVVGGTEPGCVLVRDHQGNTFLLEG